MEQDIRMTIVGQYFKDYIKTQQQVDDLYRQPNE
ncbi:unnamed protein product [Paramecium sonneborni]|uniref:Uncharacterized protein n=1 Tax=Paramecium sonneborni TaxID=65129 RepID=A0A8S1RST2_9CILI|nr:unnamed protein product [Paramecium sonneborni]